MQVFLRLFLYFLLVFVNKLISYFDDLQNALAVFQQSATIGAGAFLEFLMTTPPSPTSQTTQVSPLTHSFLSILLVLIEAVLALVLRLDGNLRRAAYPLVKAETLVCVRTYLPHAQVYASFTYKGVLLDTTAPKNRTPDVTINAYSHELFLAVMGNNIERIDGLQMRGDGEAVAQVRAFLQVLGVGGMFGVLFKKFRSSPADPAETANKKQNELAELKTALSQKNREIQALISDNKKLSAQLYELQGKYNAIKIGIILMAVITILTIVGAVIW